MNFNYVTKQYDTIVTQLFDSTFMITATINIAGKDVGQESTYRGMTDSIDARQTKPVKISFPLDLDRHYRIVVYPLDKKTIKTSGVTITYGLAGRHEPFDRWISCPKSAVAIRNGANTLFDFAASVSVQGILFGIKAVVTEDFGDNVVLHVFLTKEINE